jgi:hypothetical protein
MEVINFDDVRLLALKDEPVDPSRTYLKIAGECGSAINEE